MPAPIIEPSPMTTASKSPSLRARAGLEVVIVLTSLTRGKHFIREFLNSAATLSKCKLASWSCAVDAQNTAAHILLFRHEKTVLFHPMQGRVEGSWGNLVAVVCQLTAHPCPVDWLLRGVMKDVQVHRSSKQFFHCFSTQYRTPILIPDISSHHQRQLGARWRFPSETGSAPQRSACLSPGSASVEVRPTGTPTHTSFSVW